MNIFAVSFSLTFSITFRLLLRNNWFGHSSSFYLIETVKLLRAVQMIEIPLTIFSVDKSTDENIDFDSVINSLGAINNVGVLMDFSCWHSSNFIASVGNLATNPLSPSTPFQQFNLIFCYC